MPGNLNQFFRSFATRTLPAFRLGIVLSNQKKVNFSDLTKGKSPSLIQIEKYLIKVLPKDASAHDKNAIIDLYRRFLSCIPTSDQSALTVPDPDTLKSRIQLLLALDSPSFTLEEIEAVFSDFDRKKALLLEVASIIYRRIVERPISKISEDNPNLTSLDVGKKLHTIIIVDLEKATETSQLEIIWTLLRPLLHYNVSSLELKSLDPLLHLLFYYKRPETETFNAYHAEAVKKIREELLLKREEIKACIKNNCITNPNFLSSKLMYHFLNKVEFKAIKERILDLIETLNKTHPELAKKLLINSDFDFSKIIEKVKESDHEVGLYNCLFKLHLRDHYHIRDALLNSAYLQDPNTPIMSKWYWLINPTKELIPFPMNETLKENIKDCAAFLKGAKKSEANLTNLSFLNEGKPFIHMPSKEKLEFMLQNYLKSAPSVDIFEQRVQKIKSFLKWKNSNPLFWSSTVTEVSSTTPPPVLAIK